MLELVPGERNVSDPASETPASRLQELLARVGRGDREAFSALYDEMAPRVLGLVTRLLRDPAQSEEVTQEIFLEILGRLETVETIPYNHMTSGACAGLLTGMVDRNVILQKRIADRLARLGVNDCAVRTKLHMGKHDKCGHGVVLGSDA